MEKINTHSISIIVYDILNNRFHKLRISYCNIDLFM